MVSATEGWGGSYIRVQVARSGSAEMRVKAVTEISGPATTGALLGAEVCTMQ